MFNIKNMETAISLILMIGMGISVGLVLIGGTLYLLQHGGEPVRAEFMQTENYRTNATLIWETALAFSPFGIIELGILVLVATQAIRVGLLAYFYGVVRDYKFLLISLFILSVLIYSFFFRH